MLTLLSIQNICFAQAFPTSPFSRSQSSAIGVRLKPSSLIAGSAAIKCRGARLCSCERAKRDKSGR
jgi:hypothetical protein